MFPCVGKKVLEIQIYINLHYIIAKCTNIKCYKKNNILSTQWAQCCAIHEIQHRFSVSLIEMPTICRHCKVYFFSYINENRLIVHLQGGCWRFRGQSYYNHSWAADERLTVQFRLSRTQDCCYAASPSHWGEIGCDKAVKIQFVTDTTPLKY